MRFKDYLKIGLVTIIGYTTLGQDKEPFKFDGNLMEPYRVGEFMPIDEDRNNIPDHLMGVYDLNRNGVPDVGAWFHVNSYVYKDGNQLYDLNKFAERVVFDYNEDGKIDAWYSDTTGTGNLERMVLDKKIKLYKS